MIVQMVGPTIRVTKQATGVFMMLTNVKRMLTFVKRMKMLMDQGILLLDGSSQYVKTVLVHTNVIANLVTGSHTTGVLKLFWCLSVRFRNN